MTRQTCPVDGCGREAVFQITVTNENGNEYDIPVCQNHNTT